jgi:hypothetical protein
MLKLIVGFVLVGLAASSSARANTIVVDVAGGGAFTSIQAGVDAAQPGDVVLVMGGYYSGFTLAKPITVIGVGNAYVVNGNGTATIQNITAGQRAVIVNLITTHMAATNCAGHVIVVDCRSSNTSVSQCADMRFNRDLVIGLTVSGSRVEVAGQPYAGLSPSFVTGAPQPGRPGIACSSSSRVHVALSNIEGLPGESSQYYYGSDGGPGLQLNTGDVVILAGSHIIGGTEGWGFPHPTEPPCNWDGIPGPGIRFVSPGLVEQSGSTIDGAMGFDPYCNGIVAPAIQGAGTLTAIAPDDPALEMIGTPTPGGTVQVVVHAPPGSNVRLKLGRNPILVADGLTEIEQLSGTARQANLGIVSASGQITVNWNLPGSWTVGSFAVLQADVTVPGGALRRTNSVPVVAR